MKKLILISRRWGKTLASRIVEVFDSFSSGGTPYIPIALPLPFSAGAQREYDGMRAQQDFAYRQMLGAQAGAMGGYGGDLLARLMGTPPGYPRVAGFTNPLQEGKVNVQVKLTRIDKEHVLVEVECIQRIVHNNKELRELTAKLIEDYAEQYLFQAAIQKATIAPQREPGSMEVAGDKKEAKA